MSTVENAKTGCATSSDDDRLQDRPYSKIARDCARIVRVLRENNVYASTNVAFDLWRKRSDLVSGWWVQLPEDDVELFETIRLTGQLLCEQPPHCPTCTCCDSELL